MARVLHFPEGGLPHKAGLFLSSLIYLCWETLKLPATHDTGQGFRPETEVKMPEVDTILGEVCLGPRIYFVGFETSGYHVRLLREHTHGPLIAKATVKLSGENNPPLCEVSGRLCLLSS